MFLATYLIARDDILTNIIVSELKARKVDVLTPVIFAEVCLRDGKRRSPHLLAALQKIYSQLKAGLLVCLNAHERYALRTLIELKGYCPDETAFGTPLYNRVFRCVTHADRTQYLNMYGWRKYRILEFGKQTATARAAIKRELSRAHHMSGVIKYQKKKRAAMRARKTWSAKLSRWSKRAISEDCIVM